MSDRHDLIIAAAACGDLDHAWALALAIDSARYRDLAFADIARVADAGGSLDRADDALSRILDPHVRSVVQNELLSNAAARGDFNRAERIARAAPEPHVRTGLLLTVIRALAAAGRRDRALALAVLLAERRSLPGGLCASPACGRPFAMTGRGAPRRYCSARCGSRERVAAHRRARR
ncbi:CGNR zinc finger domain-containing protein [Spirillospora sp. NPDC049652]